MIVLSKKSKVVNLSPSLVTNLGWIGGLIWSSRASPVTCGPEQDKLSDPYQLQLFRVLILTLFWPLGFTLFQLIDFSLHFHKLGELFQDFSMQTCRKTCVHHSSLLVPRDGKAPLLPPQRAEGWDTDQAYAWSRGQAQSLPRVASRVIDVSKTPACFVGFIPPHKVMLLVLFLLSLNTCSTIARP